jgi:hypothetical protein
MYRRICVVTGGEVDLTGNSSTRLALYLETPFLLTSTTTTTALLTYIMSDPPREFPQQLSELLQRYNVHVKEGLEARTASLVWTTRKQ